MTQIEWQQLEAVISKMTDAEKQCLAELLGRPSIERPARSNPSLGLFADEPELIDEIMEGVYHAREHDPLRLAD